MNEGGPEFVAASVRVPLEADTEDLDLALDALDKRLGEIAESFAEALMRGVDEAITRIEESGMATGGASGGVPSSPPAPDGSWTEVLTVLQDIRGIVSGQVTRVGPGGY